MKLSFGDLKITVLLTCNFEVVGLNT